MKLTEKERRIFLRCAGDIISHELVQSMNGYIQHGRVSCLQHSLSVAYCSFWLCRRLRLRFNMRSLIRGALLHDFFLYDWHKAGGSHGLHGFTHPTTALLNAKKHFRLNKTEQDIIHNHMWPLTIYRLPHCRETLAVCVMDKYCSLAETFRCASLLPACP